MAKGKAQLPGIPGFPPMDPKGPKPGEIIPPTGAKKEKPFDKRLIIALLIVACVVVLATLAFWPELLQNIKL